ncbi:MAG: ThuA domain-containing protein [Acidobacteria bacterium]|nr:MAG: ThuA domain-containing protein [Acidobacteriota bacterium]
MKSTFNRRELLQTGAIAAASIALPIPILAARKKSVLVFTKSSGWEHDVVKRVDGKASIVDQTITSLGGKHGFDVTATKDGRVFDSKDLHSYAAVFFFTTGDLTTAGTDRNSPMSPQGKQSLLDAIRDGLGFVGVHAATDTFHTQPDPENGSNRYVAHGDKSDPYLRMLGGEFITHGSTPRLQTTYLLISDPKFPGLEGVSSPVSLNDEWYSLKDFRTDMHVILTLDTEGMSGKPYQRPPYPITWARMEGKGRVFYTAIGDRPENWANAFFLNLLGGGIRWSIGDVNASLEHNLSQAAPGYNAIPPKPND